MALIVIPARFASTRFPGKPLVLINNIPMVIHVYNQAAKSKFSEKIIIATDDKRIFDCAKKYNCNVVMTSTEHKSGTDRVAEVAKKYQNNIVVNLQGDEPFIEPSIIDEAIEVLKNDENADISTPVKEITDYSELNDPNIVKVAFGENDFALYFSRTSIPFYRNGKDKKYFKHIGLYAFKHSSLLKFVKLKEGKLEKIEKLEQLRALENGMKIKVFKTAYHSIGIDTPEDLKRVKL